MTQIAVNQLTKLYKSGKGIKEFNLTLKEKDVVLLLGPNGAGKTTAMSSILGLISPQQGTVEFNNKDIQSQPTEFLNSVGAMISTPVFYDYMTGYENLALYARFYQGIDEARIIEVLDLVELTGSKDQKVAKYSTGMKQSLDFARAILHHPKFLFLDEPFNGMDIEKKVALRDHVLHLVNTQSIGVVLSSHMVGDLEKIGNRVILVYDGKVLFDGTMQRVLEENTSLETFYLEKIQTYKLQKVGA
jgi:ABC-2 type transport system ATP-binding protein